MRKYFNLKTLGIAGIALLVLCLFLSKTIYTFNMPQITAAAPFTGKLSKIETATGVFTTATGEPTITCTIPIENTFVAVGDQCRMSNFLRDFNGIVNEIKIVDRTKTVTITFSNTEVQPGESYTVIFTKESAGDECLVPNGAIQQDSKGYFLYKIKRRKGILGDEYYVEKTRIYIGDSDNSNTVILSDIGFFEPVVLSSNKSFEEGATIAVMNAGDFFAKD